MPLLPAFELVPTNEHIRKKRRTTKGPTSLRPHCENCTILVPTDYKPSQSFGVLEDGWDTEVVESPSAPGGTGPGGSRKRKAISPLKLSVIATSSNELSKLVPPSNASSPSGVLPCSPLSSPSLSLPTTITTPRSSSAGTSPLSDYFTSSYFSTPSNATISSSSEDDDSELDDEVPNTPSSLFPVALDSFPLPPNTNSRDRPPRERRPTNPRGLTWADYSQGTNWDEDEPTTPSRHPMPCRILRFTL